jgi:hypothetical protein
MRRLLMVVWLSLLALHAGWAETADEQSVTEVTRLRGQIVALQTELATSMAQCRGEEEATLLSSRINELYARLRSTRGSLDQGGDVCATAYMIPSLPFCDTGTTVGAANDYTPPSSCGNSNAPDVVYVYVPSGTSQAAVSLCGSSFNTILHIWRGCPGQPGAGPVACNNDAPGCGTASCLTNVDFVGGVVYYIIVDGAGTASGDYRLNIGGPGTCPVDPCVPICPWSCPPGALAEPEACPPAYPDYTNGGCYSWPVLFTSINCGDTYCGTSQTGIGWQDHDAYSVTLTQRDSLRWCVYSQFDVNVELHQFFTAG